MTLFHPAADVLERLFGDKKFLGAKPAQETLQRVINFGGERVGVGGLASEVGGDRQGKQKARGFAFGFRHQDGRGGVKLSEQGVGGQRDRPGRPWPAALGAARDIVARAAPDLIAHMAQLIFYRQDELVREWRFRHCCRVP